MKGSPLDHRSGRWEVLELNVHGTKVGEEGKFMVLRGRSDAAVYAFTVSARCVCCEKLTVALQGRCPVDLVGSSPLWTVSNFFLFSRKATFLVKMLLFCGMVDVFCNCCPRVLLWRNVNSTRATTRATTAVCGFCEGAHFIVPAGSHLSFRVRKSVRVAPPQNFNF